MSKLDRLTLYGRTLYDWHRWLTHDAVTGEPTGHLKCPCSRYGIDSEDCAWWAIALECVIEDVNGPSQDPEGAMDSAMGLAVNNHDDVGDLVYDYWFSIPAALRKKLGTKKEVKVLIS